MPKTINTLKHRHRNRVWLDREGQLWFFHPMFKDWVTLVSLTYGDSRDSEGFIPVPAQIFMREVSPFTAAATAVYYEDAE